MVVGVLLSLTISMATFAQNDADPAVTSFGFGSESIPVNGTTTLSLFILNNGNFQSLVPGSFAIQVSLTNADEYKAEPEGPAAVVAGHPADLFN